MSANGSVRVSSWAETLSAQDLPASLWVLRPHGIAQGGDVETFHEARTKGDAISWSPGRQPPFGEPSLYPNSCSGGRTCSPGLTSLGLWTVEHFPCGWLCVAGSSTQGHVGEEMRDQMRLGPWRGALIAEPPRIGVRAAGERGTGLLLPTAVT